MVFERPWPKLLQPVTRPHLVRRFPSGRAEPADFPEHALGEGSVPPVARERCAAAGASPRQYSYRHTNVSRIN
jgi:hypothetical protein